MVIGICNLVSKKFQFPRVVLARTHRKKTTATRLFGGYQTNKLGLKRVGKLSLYCIKTGLLGNRSD